MSHVERDCQLDYPSVIDKAITLRHKLDMAIAGMQRDHANHAVPGRTLEPTSGGEPSDPTFQRAAAPNPVARQYNRAINRANSAVQSILTDLTRQPSTPDRPCRNCRDETATHPRGNPQRCEACDRYRRRNHMERPDDLIQAARERKEAAAEWRRRAG